MDRRHRPLFSHRLIAVGAALALLATACGSSDEPAASSGEETASSDTTVEATDTEETNTGETNTGETSTEATDTEVASDDASGNDPATFFPDVLAAEATQADDGTWTFSVTLSSPYDTPEQYADAWRVVGPDGTELGLRFLTHDHASEQPFTRSQSGIEIPDGITTVTIEGRDQANGWGGTFLEFDLPT